MRFIKKIFSQDLVKEKYKREWSDKIYDNELMKEVVDRYALSLEKDTRQLIPGIKDNLFTDGNPEITAVIGKALICQMIEQIFQSAKNDRLRAMTNGAAKWDTPSGIAQGAVNLIKPTDLKDKQLFIIFIAESIIALNSNAKYQDIFEWMTMSFKRNGWRENEIDGILNYK